MTITETIPLSDVSAYVMTEREIIFDIGGVDSALQSVANLSNTSDDLNNINTYRQLRDEFDVQWAAMNATDKAVFARYIKANEAVFNYNFYISESDSLNFARNSLGTYEDDFENDVHGLLIIGAKVTFFMGAAYFSLDACPVTGGWTCVVALVSAAMGVKYLLKFKAKVLNIADKTYSLISTRVNGWNARSNNINNNQLYALGVQGERRTFYSADGASSNAKVQSFWTACDKGKDYWNTLADAINAVSNIFVPNFALVGTFPHPEDKTSYSTKWLGEKADYLSVANISNPNVSLVSQNKVNDELQVKFTTAATTDQSFTFDLVYNDNTFQRSVSVSATLIVNINNNLPDMISVQGGTFTMGGDPDVSYQVTPIHQVTLSNFQISKYEITNAQFAAFLTAMGNQIEGGVEWYIPAGASSYSKIAQNSSNWAVTVGYENTPVVNVSWYGAAAYCAWAGGRLPTEAEWEYAAKGGNQSAGYAYSGSNNIDAVAYYYYSVPQPTEALPVGQKTANELGIYDMSGNVWEWCSDWYDAYPSSAQTNPTGAASGTYRVLRGGSWCNYASHCRSSYRYDGYPYDRYVNFGFRLAL